MVTKFKPGLPLNGHIFAYGRTDSGKTWKLVAVVQYYHSHGYKIWDLWGGKRKEGGFWCFKSDEDRLWFDFTRAVGEMTNEGPKEYNVNLMYPLFVDELPNRLPSKKPRVIAKPFTLYFKDIEIDEISTITGALSQTAINLWVKIRKELPNNSNGEDLLAWFEKSANTKYKKLTLYTSFIYPFCKSKILMGKGFKYNLDLKGEAEDKETITILMDDYTPERYKMFFILHFMEKVYKMGENDEISRKNLGLFRELNYFMKVQDESQQDAEQKQIMRNHFSNIARYGRSSFLIAGDTQSPSEVRGLVEGQDDLLLLNEMPSPSDRERTCDHLIRDGRMSSEQRDYLGSTQMSIDEDKKPNYKGKLVVVERGKRARLITRVQPPRTKCFKVKDGSFNKVWKKIYNDFIDIKEHKQDVKDNYLLVVDKKEREKTQEYFEPETIEVSPIDSTQKERLNKLKIRELEQLEEGDLIV